MTEPLDLCVVSHGGSGSTMLISFLANHLRTNSSDSLNDGLKHCNSPDHPFLRKFRPRKIIYCYDDPRNVVLSLFRRGIALGMQSQLRFFSDNLSDYINLAKNREPIVKNLSEFFDFSYDCFGINNFWHNWTRVPLDCPVLFVKYSGLWDSLSEIFSFAGISEDKISLFPVKQERNTSLSDLSEKEFDVLTQIYESTISEMRQYPSCFYRNPSLG